MSIEIYTRKVQGVLMPADGFSVEELDSLKPGIVYKVEVKTSRNYKFLQKAFVLVHYAFDIWKGTVKPLSYKGEPVTHTIEQFRDLVTILAGYYIPTYMLDGSIRLVAKSWSFSNMPDDSDFEKLYQALITVIVEKVLTGYTKDDLNQIVQTIITQFA